MTTVINEGQTAALLENILDALDRLFDRECACIDILALLIATAEALRDTPHSAELNRAIVALSDVVRSGADRETQRELALDLTNSLRHYLAAIVPSPA
ncbi:MAG TPA: hypothetical protein VHO25_02640 [Polyangiaceae bacterium]|nr:hypothetical protein [Polyangiaceae bacterium]